VGLKLIGTHQLLAYADEALIDASKEVGLKINVGKTSCHKNAGQNHDIKIANRSFENVSQF
jgi:hypothetical protein